VAFLLFLIPGFPKRCPLLCPWFKSFENEDLSDHLYHWPTAGNIAIVHSGDCVRNQQDQAFFIITAVSLVILALGYFLGQKWLKKFHKHPPKVKTGTDSDGLR